MAYIQTPKSSVLKRALVGNQKNLPEFLQKKIAAAPEQGKKTAPVKKKAAPSRKKSLGYYNKANDTGTGAAAGGGMTAKGTAKYRKDNPGSNLKTAVTTPPSKLKPGSKAAKRRKAFCARSKSWKSKRGRAARRRWNC